jgi:SET domain-containing protein
MTLLDDHLEVKDSTLPGTGKGLFTNVFIPKGTRITEYKGRVMTWKQARALPEEHNGYVFWFSNSRVIDAWNTGEGVAHFANDAKGIVKQRGVVNNAEYEIDSGRCYIVSTRDIPAGSEIFVEYGREYWSAIRYNLKLEGREN